MMLWNNFQIPLTVSFESSNHHPNIIVAGVFKLGDIDWSADVQLAINQATSTQHNRLFRITEDFSLTRHVKCLTRPTSGKTLDLLFSSYPHVISDDHTVPGMSDHLAILFHINVKATGSFKPPNKVLTTKGPILKAQGSQCLILQSTSLLQLHRTLR